MNKSWLTLIIIGVVFLVAAIAWEAFQNFSGARSNIDTTLIEYQRETLFSTKLEKLLTSDPKYINQISNTTNNTDTTNFLPTVNVSN